MSSGSSQEQFQTTSSKLTLPLHKFEIRGLILKQPLHVFSKIQYNKQHFALQYYWSERVRTGFNTRRVPGFLYTGNSDHYPKASADY